MSLKGSSNEERIWNYLVAKGISRAGAAGLMGNLYAESGLRPNNLQNISEKRLDYTDESYTKAVDDGGYKNFVRDSAGYGIAQWTYWSRKQNMLDFARAAGKSIGDLEMQLDFLFKELSGSYKAVLSALRTATTVKAASDCVLTGFERPKNQSSAVKAKREEYGQAYYDKYAKTAATGTGGGTKGMTEEQVREKIVAVMRGWIGLKRSNKSHAVIIDTYNAHKPLPRGYKVSYTDDYCATTVSAAAIKAEYTDIMPVECSCKKLIEQAQKMGIWQESDAYVPASGDMILYDWQDVPNFAATDNMGAVEHVGMVEKIRGNTITIIEGNMSGGIVGRRTITVNGRYIRGYICPNYSKKATATVSNPSKPAGSNTGAHDSFDVEVEDVVKFTGNTQYTTSYASGRKKTAKSCNARITKISKGKPHPYHVVGTGVYGWVDAADITR